MTNRHHRVRTRTYTKWHTNRSERTTKRDEGVVCFGFFFTCSRWKKYVKSTCRRAFMEVRSSAFFSRDWTHTFLFCLQREAAALFRSRNLRLFSSGSSLVVLRRRPPVLGGFGAGGTGEACTTTTTTTILIMESIIGSGPATEWPLCHHSLPLNTTGKGDYSFIFCPTLFEQLIVVSGGHTTQWLL